MSMAASTLSPAGTLGLGSDAQRSSYAPFQGLTAWFSCSVHPNAAKTWRRYGGTYATEWKADYLFSDDASSKDTVRAITEQQGISIFVSNWITDVVRLKAQPNEVPIGRYFLPPPFASWQSRSSSGLANIAVPSNPPTLATTTDGTAEKLLDNESQVAVGTNALQKDRVGLQSPDECWRKLEETSEKLKIESLVHVNQMQLDEAPLLEFIPLLPGYSIQRRK